MVERDVGINVKLHGMEDAKNELNSFVSTEREVEVKIVTLTEKVTQLSEALKKMRTNAAHINSDINTVSREILEPSEQPPGRPPTGSAPSTGKGSRGGAPSHKSTGKPKLTKAQRDEIAKLEEIEKKRAEKLAAIEQLQNENDAKQDEIKHHQIKWDSLTGNIISDVPQSEPEPVSQTSTKKKTRKKQKPEEPQSSEEIVQEEVVTQPKPKAPRKKKAVAPPASLIEPPPKNDPTAGMSFEEKRAYYLKRSEEEKARLGVRKKRRDIPLDVSALKYPESIKVSRMPAGWGESYIRSLKDIENPVTDINSNGIAQAEVALERSGDPGVSTLVAKLGKEIVGALSYSIEKNNNYKQMTISDIGAKYKHGGIGTRLIQDAEKIARSLLVDVIKISNALPDAHDTYINNMYEMRDTSDRNMHTTDMYKRLSGMGFDTLEKSKFSHSNQFEMNRRKALLNAAFNTRKTGNESPAWIDILGRNLPVDYTATPTQIKLNKESATTLQSYKKAYELWHTHPGENYPVMSGADIKSAVASGGPFGVMASDTLRGIKIDPSNIDTKGGELLADYWENIADSLYETNGDEIVDYATQKFGENKGSTEDFTNYLHPYVNELLYKKFKEMLVSVDIAFEEVDYSKFLDMPIEASKKKDDPIKKVYESFIRNKNITAKDLMTVGSQHGLKLTSESSKALLKTFRDTYKRDLEAEEAKELSSVDIAKEEVKKPVRKPRAKKQPSVITPDIPASPDELHDILFRLPDIKTSTSNAQGVADLLTNLKKILGDAWTITAHKPQTVDKGIQSQSIDAKIMASLGTVDKLRETLIDAFSKALESSTIPLPVGDVMGIKTRIGPAKKPPLGPQQDAHVHEYTAMLAEAKTTETQLAADEKNRTKELTERFSADLANRKEYAKEQATSHRELLGVLTEGRRLTASHIFKYQDSIRNELKAEYMARPGAKLESAKSIAADDEDSEKKSRQATIERLQAEILNLKFLDKEQKEAMKNTDAFGRTINRLVEKGGILGRLSWSFTSLAMSSLGVYFSLMSIVNMLSQGIMSVFNPLQNLQSLIQGFALGQSKFKGTSIDLNEYFKRLFGDDKGLQHIIDAWMYLQQVMGTFNTTLAGFGAKVLLDPEVQASIERIIAAVQDFLTDEATFTMVKDLIKGIADHMPEIVEGFRDLGRLIQMVIIPNIGLFVKAWSTAMILMPVMSLASALFNVLKILFSTISAVNMFRTAMIAAMGTDTYVAAMKKAFFHPMVAMAGTHGALAGTAYATGFIAGIAGIYALDQLGIMKGARQAGANVGNWIQGKPQTVLKEEKHEWWDLIGAISGTPYNKIFARAEGGPLRAGQMAVVGERGPELLIPKGDVDVIPNHQIRFLASGTTTLGSGEMYHVTIYNTDPNMSSAKIAAALEKAGIPKTVKVTIKDALKEYANEISYYNMPEGTRMPYGKDPHSIVLTSSANMPGMGDRGGFAFEPPRASTVPAPWLERGIAISDTVVNDKDLGNRMLHEAAHTYGLKADDMLKSTIFNKSYGEVTAQPTPVNKDDVDAHSSYLKYIFGDEDFVSVNKESVKETKSLTDGIVKLTRTLWELQTNPKFRLGNTTPMDIGVVPELQTLNKTVRESEDMKLANVTTLTGILNKQHGGNAEADSASIFGNRTVPGTNVLQAQGVSLAGGPGSMTDLENVGSWTMSQGGKTWNMNTSVGLGEALSFSAPNVKKQSETEFGKIGANMSPEPNLGILPYLMLGSTITSLGGALATKSGALKGMLSGGAGKLTGMFGKGAATAGEPLTMEIAEMLGAGGRGAETFEILGKPATMTPKTSPILSKASSMLARGMLFTPEMFPAFQQYEEKEFGAPKGGYSHNPLERIGMFSNMLGVTPHINAQKDVGPFRDNDKMLERLTNTTFKTNEILENLKKEQHEDNKISTNYLAGINSKILSQTKPGGAYPSKDDLVPAGMGGPSGSGTSGSGGAGTSTGSKKPTGTAADFLPPGPTGGILTASPYTPGGVIEEANPYHKPKWSEGTDKWAKQDKLTGDVIKDFRDPETKTSGPGWGMPYKPDDSYGWDNSAGAPSVGYGGIDPYYAPGTANNGRWTEIEKGKHYYTDFTGKTFGPFPREDLALAEAAGANTNKPQSSNSTTTKAGSKAIAAAAVSQEHAAKWQTATAKDFGYQDIGAGAAGGQVGEIVQQGKETYVRQADGSLKLISSMAAGGLLTKGGLINAHAGEVIGPLGQVASTLAQAANISSTNNNATNQNITVNITITGDATKDVTDDMIRKIKRDLFGRGVT